MSRLFLVRHGLTDHNSAGRFMGHTDADLSAGGLRQVEKLRERLSTEKFDAVYSSDLKRTLQTADAILSSSSGMDICHCPELREINYGEAERLTYSEIQQKYPDLAKAIRQFSQPDMDFPGGENWQGFVERTLKFRDKLSTQKSGAKILIVSHGGPIKTLICDLLGLNQSYWPSFRVDNASVSIVDTYPQRVILSLLNDTSHLKKGPNDEED